MQISNFKNSDKNQTIWSLFKYWNKFSILMCEALDEIHEAQLAVLIAKMRREKEKTEKPIEVISQ